MWEDTLRNRSYQLAVQYLSRNGCLDLTVELSYSSASTVSQPEMAARDLRELVSFLFLLKPVAVRKILIVN